jgi:hypothetical protein
VSVPDAGEPDASRIFPGNPERPRAPHADYELADVRAIEPHRFRLRFVSSGWVARAEKPFPSAAGIWTVGEAEGLAFGTHDVAAGPQSEDP